MFEYFQQLIDSPALTSLTQKVGYRALLAGFTAFAFSILVGRWFISWVCGRRLLEQTAKGDSELLDDLLRHVPEEENVEGCRAP